MRFRLLRKEGEAVFPEFGQVGPQFRQPLRSGAIEPPCPHATLHDEAGLPQHAEVLGDGGAGQFEVGGDGARGELRVPDEAEDFPAVGFGDCVLTYVSRGLFRFSRGCSGAIEDVPLEPSPRSSVDRASASEAESTGSSPVGGTIVTVWGDAG